MSELGSLLAYLRDPRLTAHATSGTPAWLWSVDATRVLWANPPAAAAFDAASPAALAGFEIDPKGSAALQIARIAGTLPLGAAPRLERLRGFGAKFGRALMCACSRVVLEDRTPAILVVSTEPVGAGLPLAERVRRLCTGIEQPVAFFSTDGQLIQATASGETQLAGLKSLAALGAEQLAEHALSSGHASGPSQAGPVTFERIGSDATTVLLALFTPSNIQTEPAPAPVVPPAASKPPEPVVPAPPVQPAAAVHTRPAATDRRQTMRFVWQMDADGRLTIGTEEFIAMIGAQSAKLLGRPWRDVAAELDVDPEGQVERAIATRDTWSGIHVAFPMDGNESRLPVELSGLPVFDRERNFLGYRGFGVCRNVPSAVKPQPETIPAPPLPLPPEPVAGVAPKTEIVPAAPVPPAETPEAKAPPQVEPPAPRDERPALTVVPPVENVLPFRASAPPEKSPNLTPVERKAFRELASKLTARLREAQNGMTSGAATDDVPSDLPFDEPAVEPPPPPSQPVRTTAPAAEAERTISSDQRPILDRLPLGVLVYRLDRLLYANRAFLDWTGYDSIHALADAGGLDALFIEPVTDASSAGGAKGDAKTLAITTSHGSQMPIEARLFSTPWDGESALVLMLAGTPAERRKDAEAPPADAATEARELRAILDTASDGVIVLDCEGRVISTNRSAEVMFGHQSRELGGLPLAGLFAPESQRIAFDTLDRVNREGSAGTPSESREVLGRGREGVPIPLVMTMGRIAGTPDKLVAIFRDVAAWKNAEENPTGGRRQAETASSAKSDFLAKISHEIRTPLNAIIGFSEVMMEERFGPVGNERYKQYLKDIHASGTHLISLLNDLLDLSKIEAGKLDLTFVRLDLNEVTQQCVALMQPQASRERIIIRTALSSTLPPVLADARSVRQIALNLLSNSIKFTNAGGQVIVSTAAGDNGGVVLRVRDTGVGMSEKDIAVALEPFRQLATSSRTSLDGTGLGLPLTKALAEANRATFNIKCAVNAGTLIEVAFPGTPLAAE